MTGLIKVGQENSTPIELYYEDHGAGSPVVLIHERGLVTRLAPSAPTRVHARLECLAVERHAAADHRTLEIRHGEDRDIQRHRP
jgi:hypothetical protein